MAPIYERRTGPRKVALASALAPYSRWDPILPGGAVVVRRNQFVASKIDAVPLPARDKDVSFAPLAHLALSIQNSQLTFAKRLTCFIFSNGPSVFRYQAFIAPITLTHELALGPAEAA